MSKVKKSIYDILRGSFLTDESAFKNWRIIIFVVALLLVVITSAHNADKKVLKISELNKKRIELREKYIASETQLMQMKMESNVRQKAKEIGLFPTDTPPTKIKVTQKKD
ncbi:MAG: S-adenosyl-methyltransferase [Flavobacteriaceae bacterium]